ncbi:MAG: 23S rRNA (adenine(2503)-C(2))-methyltransferase RlmN [Desulfuromonadales bacterium]|nr:23S rRNA (adenine(2503)-C(2))-methyltransferase RlmN [Desulfuromonadales bacterium]
MDDKIDLKNMTDADLATYLARLGQPAFRAGQLLKWIYQQRVTDFAEMTNISKALREKLSAHCRISTLTPVTVQQSRDGTRKYLFQLEDGATIEAVRIPMETEKATLCISTQAGCAMGCTFCMTATSGLLRNLSVAEIVNQVCAALEDGPIGNIVLMGMGEPLHNLDNVVAALNILYLDEGLGYGARRVTLSTCGLVPEILELKERIKVNLAVSLNAADDEVRSRLMPINKRFSLAELIPACVEFSQHNKQRVTFEYILIRGVNDSLAMAKKLVKLLHPVRCKVNLIAFNKHQGADFESPDDNTVRAFQSYLLDRGMIATLRAGKGRDIDAACGQLKGKMDKSSVERCC